MTPHRKTHLTPEPNPWWGILMGCLSVVGILGGVFALLVFISWVGIEIQKQEIEEAPLPAELLIELAEREPLVFLSKAGNEVDDVYVNMLGRSKGDIHRAGGALIRCSLYADGSVSQPQVIEVAPGFEEILMRRVRQPKAGYREVSNYRRHAYLTRVIQEANPKMCTVLLGRSITDDPVSKTPVPAHIPTEGS